MKEKTMKKREPSLRGTLPLIEVIRVPMIGAALGLLAAWLCYRSIAALPVAALIAVGYCQLAKKELLRRQKKKLNMHFRDFLSSLHTAMKAGYSLENGVRQAAGDVEKLYGKKDVLSVELADIRRQMTYARPVENLFWELGQKSGVEDIRNFGEALMVAKRTGGGMAHVLEASWKSVSDRIDAEQEIDALIAAKQYEQRFLSLMPVGILLYMRLAFPDLLAKLYGEPVGIAVMTVCLGLYLAAALLARKIARIEV